MEEKIKSCRRRNAVLNDAIYVFFLPLLCVVVNGLVRCSDEPFGRGKVSFLDLKKPTVNKGASKRDLLITLARALYRGNSKKTCIWRTRKDNTMTRVSSSFFSIAESPRILPILLGKSSSVTGRISFEN